MKRNPDLELHAFLDDELDVARRLEMEDALARDAGLSARVDQLRALRSAIRGADYHVAPDALQRRIATLAFRESAEPEARRPAARVGREPREGAAATWSRRWRPLSAAFAATVALTLGTQRHLDHAQRENRLNGEVIASHVRATLGEHLIDVASSDHHTVKPYLSSKLDFSPPVRDRDIGSALLLGGRVDYLDDRPVAALVYRQGQHLVDAFVWPGDGERGVTYTTERGYQLASWTHADMHHRVVSDVNRAEFVALVEHLAATDDDTPAAGR